MGNSVSNLANSGMHYSPSQNTCAMHPCTYANAPCVIRIKILFGKAENDRCGLLYLKFLNALIEKRESEK